MNRIIAVLSCLSFSFLAYAGEEPVDYPAVASKVSYQQETALGFMGGTYEQKPEAYAAANPAGQPIHPHTVLLHGDQDSIVPLQQANLPGAEVQLQEGAGHFDWIHPGTAAFDRLLATLDEFLKP